MPATSSPICLRATAATNPRCRLSQPADPRACDHGAGARFSSNCRATVRARRTPARDRLRPVGRLDAAGDAAAGSCSLCQTPDEKWTVSPPAARAMSRCQAEDADWYASVTADTVAVRMAAPPGPDGGARHRDARSAPPT
jgi:hypothetical protein